MITDPRDNAIAGVVIYATSEASARIQGANSLSACTKFIKPSEVEVTKG